MTETRKPPASPQSEASVIGAVLDRPAVLDELLDTGLNAEDFYAPKWAAAWRAIVQIHGRGDAVDFATLQDELAGREGAPTGSELTSAMAGTPSLGHVLDYARRVVVAARLRRVIDAAYEIAGTAYEPAARNDHDAFLARAEQTLLAATARVSERDEPALLDEVLAESITNLRARAAGEQLGVPTGFIDLDRLTGGLRAGQLAVLGARPSHGKSALALDIALNVARATGPVLFVAAEMSKLELGDRVLAGGGVDSERILSGRLDDFDFERLGARRENLRGVPLRIDDSPVSTVRNIGAKARRMVTRDGLALVIVDYLQLLEPEAGAERRERQVARISMGLKQLARERHVPVIAVAQLNRSLEARADKHPILADLRDSGQLEQDADLVAFLYRPGIYDLDADPGEAELHVAKHRNGPTGLVCLTWRGSRMSFANAAPVGAL